MTDFGARKNSQGELNPNQLDAFSTIISTECSTWNIRDVRLLRRGNADLDTTGDPE
jgi:hypothetical protein